MKFSIRTLTAAVLFSGLIFAALNGSLIVFALLRLIAIVAFLVSLIASIYGEEVRRPFAVGWAICSGVTLTLIFLGVPLSWAYNGISPDPYYGHVIDLMLAYVISFGGGTFASKLAARRLQRETE